MSDLATPLPISPLWKLDLTHAVTGVAATPGAKRIAIKSEDAFISVADFGESRIQKIQLPERALHIAIDPNGDFLAVVSESRTISVLGLDSSNVGQELFHFGEAVHDVCTFSVDGRLLWTVGLVTDDFAEIRCYENRTSNLIAHHRFRPLIGGCGFIFTLHPKEDRLGLWVCGPDEVWNYWISLTSHGIEFRHQLELDGSTPPCFNSSGDRFLVLIQSELAAFSFPNCEELYEPIIATDEDDPFAESTCYLDSGEGDRVLVATNDGRLMLIAFEGAEIISEVWLEDHEPKPCYQVYTSLSKTDDQLCTDLHYFTRVGSNLILSVHTNGRASNRRDTILVWSVES